MAKRRRNWDWPRISGWFVLLFAPARADARFARTKGDYVRMLLQCLLGIAALLLPRVLHALSGVMLGALGIAIAGYLSRKRGKGEPRARADPQAAQPGRGTGAQGRSATRGGRGQFARALLLFCPQRSSILRARSSVTGSTRAQMRQPASPYSSSSTDPYLCRKETTSPRS